MNLHRHLTEGKQEKVQDIRANVEDTKSKMDGWSCVSTYGSGSKNFHQDLNS